MIATKQLRKIPSLKRKIHYRSYVKYPGNKFYLLADLLPLLPPARRFIEPFAGSCVVSINSTKKYINYLINDANLALINAHRHVAQDNGFIDHCAQFFTPDENTADRYQLWKDTFNHGVISTKDRAALLIYLNRHCFNGLMRFNQKGEFNAPRGQYDAPYYPLEEMRLFKIKAQRFTFTSEDFRLVMAQAGAGDVCYCDPPYTPKSNTANFTAYEGNTFKIADHVDLAAAAAAAASRGAVVVLSNTDNEVSRQVYAGAKKIIEVEAPRMMAGMVDCRGYAKEVIFCF